jgi:hypothetical protein
MTCKAKRRRKDVCFHTGRPTVSRWTVIGSVMWRARARGAMEPQPLYMCTLSPCQVPIICPRASLEAGICIMYAVDALDALRAVLASPDAVRIRPEARADAFTALALWAQLVDLLEESDLAGTYLLHIPFRRSLVTTNTHLDEAIAYAQHLARIVAARRESEVVLALLCENDSSEPDPTLPHVLEVAGSFPIRCGR